LKRQRQVFKVSDQLYVTLSSLAQLALLQAGIVLKPYYLQIGFVVVGSQEKQHCTKAEWKRKSRRIPSSFEFFLNSALYSLSLKNTVLFPDLTSSGKTLAKEPLSTCKLRPWPSEQQCRQLSAPAWRALPLLLGFGSCGFQYRNKV